MRDSGWSVGKHGVRYGNLQYLLLTHGDNDHVYNAGKVRKKYGGRIGIHREDRHYLTNPEAEDYTASNRFRMGLFNWGFQLSGGGIRKEGQIIAKEMERLQPDFALEDGMELEGFELKVIHTPGHTEGSCGFLDRQGNYISGDLFINHKNPRVTYIANEFQAMKDSVHKILKLPIRKVCPGHGNSFPIENLHLTYFYRK